MNYYYKFKAIQIFLKDRYLLKYRNVNRYISLIDQFETKYIYLSLLAYELESMTLKSRIK